MARRQYYGAATPTTITGSITTSSSSVAIAAYTGWPTGSFSLVIDPGLSSEEKILATSQTTGTITFTTRGYDGTTASAHNAGAVIYPVPTAVDFDEANAVTTKYSATGDLTYASAANTPATLSIGATNNQLAVIGGIPAWIASPDVPKSTVTAKGDIITATASGTPSNLAVGSDGQTLVANSAQTTGLAYTNNFAAGKNAIINGDFRVWQRGTSFSNPASLAYTTDRFNLYWDGTGATRTISQQTFTPGTAPVAGYEGAFFYRYAQSVAGSSNTVNLLIQPIEDVRVFAGQSAVLSFWAKADASRSITAAVNQNFGSGGSGAVSTTMTGTASVTTSWQRFTFTVAVPSISGKTIGTSSSLDLRISLPSGVTQTIDIWGVQLEAGSVATAFQTATGTIQGELAACQRYYYQAISSEGGNLSMGFMYSASQLQFTLTYPVTMRTLPTVVQVTGTDYWQFNRNGGQDLFNSWTLASATSTAVSLYNNTEISGTAGNAGGIASNNAATRLGFSAEL